MKYEIWLDSRYSHFDYGVAHLDDGTEKEILTFYNVGNFKDSLHIGVAHLGCDFDAVLRWHPFPGVIQFYMWGQELESVMFHNTGDSDLYIWGYCYLKPGESVELRDIQGSARYDFLYRADPFGLGRLLETDNPGATSFVGTYGLITWQHLHHRLECLYRFTPVSFLRGESEATGLELGEGNHSFDNEGRVIVEANGHKYIFEYDKGGGNNE